MRFLLLIQNVDTRQGNFRRTYQPDGVSLVNYLIQSDVLPGDDETSMQVYRFCERAQVGHSLTLRDGAQGRRMIEVYAIGKADE